MKLLKTGALVIGILAGSVVGLAQAAEKPQSIRIAVITFVSGSGATVGGPTVNAARLTIKQINEQGGIDGVPIEARYIDESGGPSKNIAQLRSIADNVDAVLGYVSSSDCLAVAPVAEQLEIPTIFSDCTTNSLFSGHDYKWIFRSQPPASANAVAMAMYILKTHPDLNSIAGLNQDYAFGHDQWTYFTHAIRALKPSVKVGQSLYTKLFSGDYSSEVTRLQVTQPDLIYSSFWGGDLVALIQQGLAQGMFSQSQVALSLGTQAGLQGLGVLPDGVVVGSEHSYLFHPGTMQNKQVAQFVRDYKKEFDEYPVSTYPYTIRRSLMALVAGYKKALADNDDQWPSGQQLVDALPGLKVATLDGPMVIRKDHQATYHEMVGVSAHTSEYPFAVFDQVIRFPASLIMPPEDSGESIEQWIASLSPATLEKVPAPQTYDQ